MKDYLLFDLDGTLTDPKVGICTCVQHALRSFGIEEQDLDKLEPFIGPPLKDSFMQYYAMNETDALKAVDKYRERFQDVGIFENEIYPGMRRLLKKLRGEGFHLAVASSKPTVFVQRILEHFQIESYFEVVMGSELDGSRVKKSEVVDEAIRRLYQSNVAREGKQTQEEALKEFKQRIYMIGDTRFDVEGARECGVESVAVSYGYGSLEDLMGAHADYIVRSVEELQGFLLRTLRDREENTDMIGRVSAVILPMLVFMMVRTVVFFLLGRLIQEGTAFLPDSIAARMVVMNEGKMSFTGNVTALINTIAFLCGTGAIYARAKEEIRLAWEDTKLSHLWGIPIRSMICLGSLTLGLVMGLNLLFQLTGFMELSDDYAKVADKNTQVSLALGIVVFGIVAPVAEELLFRGLLYNRLRSFARRYPVGTGKADGRSPELLLSRTLPAILISAFLFGVYHMNIVQGVYAFVIGSVIAYGYELTGTFMVPVIIHATANLLAWLVPIGKLEGVLGWCICVAALVIAGLSLIGVKKTSSR